MRSLYYIGPCFQVFFVQIVFWVELPAQRRLCLIFVKSWVPKKGTRWCGVGLPDIHESSAGRRVANGPPSLGVSHYFKRKTKKEEAKEGNKCSFVFGEGRRGFIWGLILEWLFLALMFGGE